MNIHEYIQKNYIHIHSTHTIHAIGAHEMYDIIKIIKSIHTYHAYLHTYLHYIQMYPADPFFLFHYTHALSLA